MNVVTFFFSANLIFLRFPIEKIGTPSSRWFDEIKFPAELSLRICGNASIGMQTFRDTRRISRQNFSTDSTMKCTRGVFAISLSPLDNDSSFLLSRVNNDRGGGQESIREEQRQTQIHAGGGDNLVMKCTGAPTTINPHKKNGITELPIRDRGIHFFPFS